jgi:hypothetical protein
MGCGSSRGKSASGTRGEKQKEDPPNTFATASTPQSQARPASRSARTQTLASSPSLEPQNWITNPSAVRRSRPAAQRFRPPPALVLTHATDCLCIKCVPFLYDEEGKIRSGWETVCLRRNCVCPLCVERDRCNYRSKGHWMSEKYQCKLPIHSCKFGCGDLNCIKCLPARRHVINRPTRSVGLKVEGPS